MADNTEWLQIVVSKLHRLHMNGSDFVEELWEFDWDEKLSKTDNFKNIRLEERALTTLTQAGAIHTIWKENFYRDQHWESMERHGWSMWSNWDTADPALRLYDNIWYVVGFDYDRFVQFCNAHDLSLNRIRATKPKPHKSKDKNALSAATPRTITPHTLEPQHYSVRTGKLTLSPTDVVSIAVSGKTKRPNGTKYLQCAVLDKLFKSVKTIKSGISFSTALTVSESKIGNKEEKKIRNAVAEINQKVAEVGGPKNLIKIQNKKIFVNNSYLK
jgi:hypothetical protein